MRNSRLLFVIILLFGHSSSLAQQFSFNNNIPISKIQTNDDHDDDGGGDDDSGGGDDGEDDNDSDDGDSDDGDSDDGDSDDGDSDDGDSDDGDSDDGDSDDGDNGGGDDTDNGDDDSDNSGSGNDDDGKDGDNGDSDDNGNDDHDNSGSGNSSDDDDNNDNSGNDNPNNGDDDQDKDDGKSSDDQDKDDDKDQEKDEDFDDDHQYYVGTVSANDGQSVIVDGSSFKGNSPWLRILNPGMLLEAYGKWENGSFLVTDIQVLMPARFAYYKGPAALFGQGEGCIEAWTNEQKNLDSSRPISKTDASVTLVAYYDGSKLLATPDTIPIPDGLTVGWVELTGKLDGNTLTWESSKAFP
jgi:hypothetical protein